MTYDLKANRGSGTYTFSLFIWPRVLGLAKKYGWRPAGTLRPRAWPQDREWSGRYDFNEKQIVAEDDALALADAVERFLPDVPGTECFPGGVPLSQLRWDRASVLRILSGPEMRKGLAGFVGFSRASGGYEIW